jgi:hypothetical protein
MLLVEVGIFSQVTNEKIKKIIVHDSKLCAEDALDESHACLTRLFYQLKLIVSEHERLVEIINSGQKEIKRIQDVQTHANSTVPADDGFLNISTEDATDPNLLRTDDALVSAESQQYGAKTSITKATMSLISRKFMLCFLKRLETIYSNDIGATFDRVVTLYENVTITSQNTHAIFHETQDTVQKLISKLVQRMIIEKDRQRV